MNGALIWVALVVMTAGSGVAFGFEWRDDAPPAQGVSAERLAAFRESLEKAGTTGLLVVRHDRIVLEWYAAGWDAGKPRGTASLAKALIGGMSLAVAMQDGRLAPDDPVSRFVPAWQADPRKSKITIAQLASHTSGLADAEEGKTAHEKLTGWKGAFWRRDPDPFTISRDQAPVVTEPGERAAYSNPGMAMLSYAITASLRDAPQKDVKSLLRERVLRPIGVADREWSVGYGQTYVVDGLPLVANWGGAAFTPRAVARVGRLMMREGDWEGARVLDAKVVRQMLDYRAPGTVKGWNGPAGPRPVLGWYTNVDRTWPAAPRDAFAGAGAQHQVLLAIPTLDLIVVRNGADLRDADHDFWQAVEAKIVNPIVAAVADPPVPPSDVIRRVRFDPPGTIVREALDSDNWPITWGDDDALYTAYGDGRGFEPLVERKLSQGLARVDGTPGDFRGTNLRSPTFERTGNGAQGAKASGLVMVDGVLYAWIRNTGNATLAWSTDRGQTWTWGWRFDGETFGCPTFLNTGRDGGGAPDDYVYTYSPDGPSAYESYDRVVLARVPRNRVRDREAYEFFTGKDSPQWSAHLADRGAAFTYPAHCARLDAVYVPALKRYLLAVSYGAGRGWGLFDAPHPWGPWTTAFTTADWGQGQTHGYRLPTKWISSDGRRMGLVFSGTKENDAFCVRGMGVDLYP